MSDDIRDRHAIDAFSDPRSDKSSNLDDMLSIRSKVASETSSVKNYHENQSYQPDQAKDVNSLNNQELHMETAIDANDHEFF